MTSWLPLILVFAFGASVGSFLNVVVYRLPREKSLIRPGSACPACGHAIRWFDNVPVFGWLWLRGRCRDCGEPISLQYPLVELAVGTLALACAFRFGLSLDAAIYFAFCAILVAITFIDLPYQIIPDELSLGGLVLGLAASPFLADIRVWEAFAGAAAGYGIIAGIILAYYLVRRQEGMGMGDAKLLGMIGAFLGVKAVVVVLVLASVQGVVVSLLSFRLGWMKKAPPLPDPADLTDKEPMEYPPDQEVPLGQAAVPFGPFLALGAMEWLFFGPELLNGYLRLLGATAG